MTGPALGYQCTIDISGDLDNFPERLIEYVYRVFVLRYDRTGASVYRVELMTDEDHLFKENYDRFYSKICPMLERAGFTIIDD